MAAMQRFLTPQAFSNNFKYNATMLQIETVYLFCNIVAFNLDRLILIKAKNK